MEEVLSIIQEIDKAGYDKPTFKQIYRWFTGTDYELIDILAKLLEQGKITYSEYAYHVK